MKWVKDNSTILVFFIIAAAVIGSAFYGDSSFKEGEGIAVNVVRKEAINKDPNKGSNKYNQNTVEYVVTVPESSDAFHVTISNPSAYAKKNGHNQSTIDCRDVTPIGNLIACENLKSQRIIESSTRGIEHWTEQAVRVSWFAFAAGVISIGLLIFTLSETRKTNAIASKTLKVARRTSIMELQPYISIDNMVFGITIPQDSPAMPLVTISMQNTGKTPMYEAGLEIRSLTATVKNKEGDVLEFKMLWRSTNHDVGQINPTDKPVIKTAIFKEWPVENPANISGDFISQSFFISGAIRFKDISTIKTGKHKVVAFMAEKESIGMDIIVSTYWDGKEQDKKWSKQEAAKWLPEIPKYKRTNHKPHLYK